MKKQKIFTLHELRCSILSKDREWWRVGQLDNPTLYLWKYSKTWNHLMGGQENWHRTYFNSRRNAIQVLKEVEGKNVKIKEIE